MRNRTKPNVFILQYINSYQKFVLESQKFTEMFQEAFYGSSESLGTFVSNVDFG